jgi:hypothetical protein
MEDTRLSAQQRIDLFAAELCRLTGQHPTGSYRSHFSAQAIAAEIIPQKNDETTPLTEADLELLADYLAAQVRILRLVASGVESELFVELYNNIGQAQAQATVADEGRVMLHLRMAETALALIVSTYLSQRNAMAFRRAAKTRHDVMAAGEAVTQ